MNRDEHSRNLGNRNADQGHVDVPEEPVVDQIENGSVPGLLDAIYTRMSIPIDSKMDQISSKSPKESELDSEAEASELAMLRRNEVQAVEGASSKWRDNAGIRKQMSFDSGSSSSEIKQVASPAQQQQELTMLKRNEVQAVAGASNKWRDTAGIRRQISFQSDNTFSDDGTIPDSVSTKLSSFDRSMTVIGSHCSESFDARTTDKASPNQVQYTNQNISRIHSQQNVDLRPVVTVDNSLLIKIMDQNQALLEKINSLNEENKQIQSAQDAQYAVLFEKINQLSKDNHQMRIQNEELAKINERLCEATRKNDDTGMQLLVRTKQMLGRETRCMLLSNKICSQCEQILTRNDYLIEKQKEILSQLADRFEKLGSSNEKLENHLLPECKTSQENWLAPPHLGGPLKFSHATFDTVNEIDGTVKYHGDLIAQCLNPYLDDLQKMSGAVEDLEEHFSRMEKTSETRLKRIETMLEVLYRPNIASRTSIFDENYSAKSSKEDLYSKSNQKLIINETPAGRHTR